MPAGEDFVGVGVLPDVAVEPTVATLREGRDLTLERARDWLRDAAVKE
jgi:C-terminal processing protease CtpA/Prc